MVGANQLHGRTADLAAVDDFVVQRGAGLVLTGPAGVGKTRLAQEAMHLASDRDVTVVWIQATASAHDIPFGAIAAYLPPIERAPEVLPMLVHAARAFRELADGRQLLLIVDDAPIIDSASALLVSQLVAAGDASVLVTQRSGETLPDSIAQLRLPRRELAMLDCQATAAIAEQLAGGPVAPATRDRLFHLSGGNPLYVHEIVLAGLDAAAWVDVRGGLELGDAIGGTARLTDLVDARFRELSPDATEAVALLALGEPLGLSDLEVLTSPAAVEELDDAGLLEVIVEGRRTQLHLGHPIYAEVLRSQMSILRQRRMYRRLADHLHESGAQRREDLMRQASWYLDSGSGAPPALLTAAARHARHAGDLALAERFLSVSFDAEPTFETGHVLADTYFRQGRTDDVERVVSATLALPLTADEVALCAMTRAVDRYWNAGDERHAEEFLALAVSDDPGIARKNELLALGCGFLAHSGDFTEALALARPLLSGPPTRALADSAVAAALSLRAMGRASEAVAVIEKAVDAYAAIGPDVTVVTMRVIGSSKALALIELGRLDEADEFTASLIDAARATGDAAALAHALCSRGWASVWRGRYLEARSHYDESTAVFTSLGRRGQLRWALIGGLFTSIAAGDSEATARYRSRLDALGPHPASMFDGVLVRAEALELLVDGQVERARARLVACAESAAKANDVVTEAACLYDLARSGRPELAADRLSTLASRADGEWLPVFAAHAAAAVADDAEGLDAARARLAELGAMAYAAEAARAAADSFARAGDQRRAARASVTASDHLAEVQMFHGVTASGLGGPDPLTRREREVAELAAKGLASKAIAEQLYVSTRTVESHLLRVYTKLGVRSRAELADTLRVRSA